MEESEYLETRVDEQIYWYDTKSKNQQNWYKILRIVEVGAAAFIPFLAGYMTEINLCVRTIVGLLGLGVTIITAVVSLCRFQENWIEYRTTCESLKHEKFLYLTKTEPYNIKLSFSLFVQRIESLISKENTKWAQYIQPKKKDSEKVL